ncbi:MAG: 30S ribosomal protein S16 [Alphaproteobacteria bacterium]|nr:30S ribosomal protein S16 [Alphaproteobacteria bacterium]
MLMIRLQRFGKNNRSMFRVVLVLKTRSTVTGKVIENLGSIDPIKHTFSINKESILKRIDEGAQLSDRIHNMLVQEKIIQAKKINVLPKKTIPKKEVPESATTNSTETTITQDTIQKTTATTEETVPTV